MLSHEPTDLWRESGCPYARAGARARVGARADDDSQARETSETTGVAHGSDADDFATRDSQADFAQEDFERVLSLAIGHHRPPTSLSGRFSGPFASGGGDHPRARSAKRE